MKLARFVPSVVIRRILPRDGSFARKAAHLALSCRRVLHGTRLYPQRRPQGTRRYVATTSRMAVR